MRRTVLTGGLGLLAAGLAGCGLRLDRDPELPSLSDVDVLRDAVARSLSAIRTDESSGAAGTAALEAFATAVGPAWDPPAGLRTPVPAPNPDPAETDLLTGLEDVAARVIEAAPTLDPAYPGPQAAAVFSVLADVTAGALLHLRSGDAALAGPLDAARGEAADAALSEETTGTEEEEAAEGDPVAAGPLAALVTSARRGVYAYERAAVHLSEDSGPGAGVRSRIAALSALAAGAAGLMSPAQPPADRPAWELRTSPEDEASAATVLAEAEDDLAGALLDARAGLAPQVFLDWLCDSAAARATAGAGQDLRFAAAAGGAAE